MKHVFLFTDNSKVAFDEINFIICGCRSFLKGFYHCTPNQYLEVLGLSGAMCPASSVDKGVYTLWYFRMVLIAEIPVLPSHPEC